ncbi:MAG: TetR/AcrR family transcriptional regulator [Acidimicrobiia bacterium]|nr:TetR/AcrR family transcriptional regulator [Acidimicrobiia bacterium]
MTNRAADGPPGKRERNKAEKQRRIIEAARELFETQGFAQTTTAQISARAGIGTGTLYLYVESKEALLVEVFHEDVGRAWHDALDHLDRSQSLLDQLLHAFGEVSDFHAHDPELARTYFRELMFLPEGPQSSTSDFMRKYYDRLSALLVEAQDNGELREDVPLAVLARNLFASWYHLMLRRYTNRITDEQVRSRLRDSFSVALLGLTPGR